MVFVELGDAWKVAYFANVRDLKGRIFEYEQQFLSDNRTYWVTMKSLDDKKCKEMQMYFPVSNSCYYFMRVGNVFSHICLSVRLCVCLFRP